MTNFGRSSDGIFSADDINFIFNTVVFFIFINSAQQRISRKNSVFSFSFRRKTPIFNVLTTVMAGQIDICLTNVEK
jgi:hypothetical protein